MRSDEQITADANRRATQRTMRSDKQIAADVNRRAAQRAARRDAQIATNANRRAAGRAAHNNAQIALENVTCANARMLLHSNKQQEMRNVDRQAHQGQHE